MRLIWKYEVKSGAFEHMMPKHAWFLDLQMQDGAPRMWFEVDEDNVREPRRFLSVPTGLTPVPFGSIYMGTFQPEPGLVFHTYETKQRLEGQ